MGNVCPQPTVGEEESNKCNPNKNGIQRPGAVRDKPLPNVNLDGSNMTFTGCQTE